MALPPTPDDAGCGVDATDSLMADAMTSDWCGQ